MAKPKIRISLTEGQINRLYHLAADRAMEERELDSGKEKPYEQLEEVLSLSRIKRIAALERIADNDGMDEEHAAREALERIEA